ncbi:tetratricopeptide repeat protein [Nonlabens ulvanivorans]|uniref:TPR domain protein n=1 Tax=Nonlabens ulvanivorans TaxID=906888 RepID=A0A084JYM2_NONUL|nr:hypothetical protein [Nonlabens ulvanivorans]KEZ94056.1 hypothetical protein IL45_02605 [Nonlabens ulvanivorans]PRX13042.1 hypothetical protein LY02_02100 [Nonlabens ulvanivorans]GAK76364.1 hypothetical protein JCM19296_1961 [Nonlabens ulvanivorans]
MDSLTLIQNVIHNRASQAEFIEFQNRLEKDPAFKALYEESLDIRAIALEQKKSKLKNLLQEQERKLNQPASEGSTITKKTSVFKFLIPAVAAAAIIIFSLNLFGNSITTLELFESNYEPYRNVMGGIERGEEIKEDLISKAFYTYEIKDYTTAAILFEQLYETDQQSMYLFYHANAQLGKGNTQKAISLYKQHQNVQDDFYARSRWYLALAYLKNDQIQESIAVLEGISKVKSYNYVKARELLLSLEDL